MKTILNLLPVLIIVFLMSCSSTYNTAVYEDDIYYSSTPTHLPEVVETTSEEILLEDDYFVEESHIDENTSYVYNYNDYYDYSYSSRIRRFHYPNRLGYYNSFYTNSYWYNYDPYYWGTSIYLGYNWWGGLYVGNRYNYWNHHSHWGYGHNAYYNGYWNGYYDGYYYGDNYFNSYDATSYHYGPRIKNVNGGAVITSSNIGTTYQRKVNNGKINNNNISKINNSTIQIKEHINKPSYSVQNTNKVNVSSKTNNVNSAKPNVNQTKPNQASNTSVNKLKPSKTSGNNNVYSKPKPNSNSKKNSWQSFYHNNAQSNVKPNSYSKSKTGSGGKSNSNKSFTPPAKNNSSKSYNNSSKSYNNSSKSYNSSSKSSGGSYKGNSGSSKSSSFKGGSGSKNNTNPKKNK